MRSLREDDDLRLMARVAAKDQRAFTILYQRYAPRLERFLSKFLKSDALEKLSYSGFHSSGEVISGFCQHILSYSSLHSDAKRCNGLAGMRPAAVGMVRQVNSHTILLKMYYVRRANSVN